MARRIYRAVLPSTQDEAIRHAREGAEDGTLVVARSQSRGRGRLDHAWTSPEGGLYLSMILGAPQGDCALFPIAVGSLIARALQTRFGVEIRVKWPNDLLTERVGRPSQKLGGILVDRVASPALGDALVVGVGLNVAAPRERFQGVLRDRVALLDELATGPVDLDSVESLVVDAIRSASAGLGSSEGREEIVAVCRTFLYGRGRLARLDGEPAGIIQEVGDDGTLWLDQDGVRVPVRAGDVTVGEAG